MVLIFEGGESREMGSVDSLLKIRNIQNIQSFYKFGLKSWLKEVVKPRDCLSLGLKKE